MLHHLTDATIQVENLVNYEALEGGPSIPYPFNYFEKYPISIEFFGKYPQNSESILFQISLKLIQVSRIPLKYLQTYTPYPFNYLANIPVSLETLPGPQEVGNEI